MAVDRRARNEGEDEGDVVESPGLGEGETSVVRELTAPAIRAYLLSDLASWPPAFHRAITPWIEYSSSINHQRHSLNAARALLSRFERDRGAHRDGSSTDCACGCSGRSWLLTRHLRGIRVVARMVREAPTCAKYRRHLGSAKFDFLRWLWITGQRKVDRVALSIHAVEEAKRSSEVLENTLDKTDETIRLAKATLAVGIFQCGPRRGEPLSDLVRAQITEEVVDAEAAICECRARIAALQRMVAEDNVPGLVRDFTGCTRETTGWRPNNACGELGCYVALPDMIRPCLDLVVEAMIRNLEARCR